MQHAVWPESDAGLVPFQEWQAKRQNFLDDLSNSSPAVRQYSEGKATGLSEDRLPPRKPHVISS
jgi:hypothetical protein